MFAVTDSGITLPPYVVYKAEAIWNTWTEGGPTGARYNRTKSGWFDEVTFRDWFFTIVVPWAKSRQGPTVVIGDNLSSHFSADVLKMCKKYNITFCCLPANTTHLTQPLDVAFYAPLKKHWRVILEEWRTTAGRQIESLPKEVFPKLLKKLMVALEPTAEKNIKSGFAATGIRPLNPQRVLDKLPLLAKVPDSTVPGPAIPEVADCSGSSSPKPGTSTSGSTSQSLSDSFVTPPRVMENVVVSLLSKMRSGPTTKTSKRVNLFVKAGRSISYEEYKQANKNTTKQNPANTPKVKSNKKHDKKKRKTTRDYSSSDSSDGHESDVPSDVESFMDVSLLGSDPEEEPEVQPVKLSSWVVVEYALKRSKKHYVGQVIDIIEDGFKVKFTRQALGGFIWPEKEDCDNISDQDVLQVLPEPITNNRGIMKFNRISFDGLNLQ